MAPPLALVMHRSPPSHPARRFGPLTFALGLVAATALSGCSGKKPTEAQCQDFTDHYIELLKLGDAKGKKVEKVPLKQRDRILELCTIEGTEAEVLCALQQATFDDIAANCK